MRHPNQCIQTPTITTDRQWWTIQMQIQRHMALHRFPRHMRALRGSTPSVLGASARQYKWSRDRSRDGPGEKDGSFETTSWWSRHRYLLVLISSWDCKSWWLSCLPLLLAIAAYHLRLQESANYWDYLLDPVYCLVSIIALAWQMLARARQGG